MSSKKSMLIILVIILFASGAWIAPTHANTKSEIIPVDTAKQVVENDIKSLTPEHEFLDFGTMRKLFIVQTYMIFMIILWAITFS